MSHSVAQAERSGHRVKREAAAINYMRKIVFFLNLFYKDLQIKVWTWKLTQHDLFNIQYKMSSNQSLINDMSLFIHCHTKSFGPTGRGVTSALYIISRLMKTIITFHLKCRIIACDRVTVHWIFHPPPPISWHYQYLYFLIMLMSSPHTFLTH